MERFATVTAFLLQRLWATAEKKRVQRFVERLRRLAMDFKTLKG